MPQPAGCPGMSWDRLWQYRTSLANAWPRLLHMDIYSLVRAHVSVSVVQLVYTYVLVLAGVGCGCHGNLEHVQLAIITSQIN